MDGVDLSDPPRGALDAVGHQGLGRRHRAPAPRARSTTSPARWPTCTASGLRIVGADEDAVARLRRSRPARPAGDRRRQRGQRHLGPGQSAASTWPCASRCAARSRRSTRPSPGSMLLFAAAAQRPDQSPNHAADDRMAAPAAERCRAHAEAPPSRRRRKPKPSPSAQARPVEATPSAKRPPTAPSPRRKGGEPRPSRPRRAPAKSRQAVAKSPRRQGRRSRVATEPSMRRRRDEARRSAALADHRPANRTRSRPWRERADCCILCSRAAVAQLVEQRFCKPPVAGSSPIGGSTEDN